MVQLSIRFPADKENAARWFLMWLAAFCADHRAKLKRLTNWTEARECSVSLSCQCVRLAEMIRKAAAAFGAVE